MQTPARNDRDTAARAGVPSFHEVFTEYGPFVWRSVRYLGIREADIEDVCQEVFIVVHRKLPEFEGRSTIRTWLYGICLRVARDHRARAHVRRETTTDTLPGQATPPEQEEHRARVEARHQLQELLDELDDVKREVFVLYELEELPMAEVAEAVGCPMQTAYSRLHAARKVMEASVRRRQLLEKVG